MQKVRQVFVALTLASFFYCEECKRSFNCEKHEIAKETKTLVIGPAEIADIAEIFL